MPDWIVAHMSDRRHSHLEDVAGGEDRSEPQKVCGAFPVKAGGTRLSAERHDRSRTGFLRYTAKIVLFS